MKNSVIVSMLALSAGSVLSAPAQKCAKPASAAAAAPMAPSKMPSYGYKAAAPAVGAAAPVAAPAAYSGAAAPVTAPYGGYNGAAAPVAAPASPMAGAYYGAKGAAAAPAAGAYYGKGGSAGSGSGSMTSSAAGSTSSAAGSTTSSAAGSTTSAAAGSTVTSTSSSTSVVTVTGSDIIGDDVTVIGDASTVTSLFTSTSTVARTECAATQSFVSVGVPIEVAEAPAGAVFSTTDAVLATMTVDTCIQLIDEFDVRLNIIPTCLDNAAAAGGAGAVCATATSAWAGLVDAPLVYLELVSPTSDGQYLFSAVADNGPLDYTTAAAAAPGELSYVTPVAATPLADLGVGALSLLFTDDADVFPGVTQITNSNMANYKYDTYVGDVSGVWTLRTYLTDINTEQEVAFVVDLFQIIIVGRGI